MRAIIPLPLPAQQLGAILHLLLSGGSYVPDETRPVVRPGEAVPGPDAPPASTWGADLAQFNLTSRQREVLEFLAQGHTNKSIASKLRLRETTVKVHIKAILKRLNVSNRTQAALLVSQWMRRA